MSDILVTGSLGRLGLWPVDHFDEEGHDVTCVDVDHLGFGTPARAGVEFRTVDLTNPPKRGR